MRYVLSLLLIRRRVVRLEETERDTRAARFRCSYCPRRETTYRVATVMPRPSARFRSKMNCRGCCLPTPDKDSRTR